MPSIKKRRQKREIWRRSFTYSGFQQSYFFVVMLETVPLPPLTGFFLVPLGLSPMTTVPLMKSGQHYAFRQLMR